MTEGEASPRRATVVFYGGPVDGLERSVPLPLDWVVPPPMLSIPEFNGSAEQLESMTPAQRAALDPVVHMYEREEFQESDGAWRYSFHMTVRPPGAY